MARLGDALRLVREVQKSQPQNPGPLVLSGIVLLAQQNHQGAIDAFNAALKLNAKLIDAHRGLGQAYQLQGQQDKAVESYRRVLAINGNDVAALNNLAWILLEERKKPDEALP